MKKFFIFIILVVVVFGFIFSACTMTPVASEEPEQDYESMFVIVEETYSWWIVYHKYTRVMYAVSDSSYNRGNFTLLVNPDGTPQLWNGE